MILFLYGTLLDPGVLARISGERALARRMRPARLPGWRRAFLRGTPYPTLLPDPASAVEGAVLRVGAGALTRLSAYEGSAYVFAPVTVATVRGAVRAHAWIAPPWRADRARPCSWSPCPPGPAGRSPRPGWPGGTPPPGRVMARCARPRCR